MRRSLALLAAAGILLTGCTLGTRDPSAIANPDPDHTHADFAVWVNGEKIDFVGPEFMSTDEKHLHEYLHLHDGNGEILHGHKQGLLFSEFLASLGFRAREGCLTVPSGGEYCSDGQQKRWRLFVNGKERAPDVAFAFADLDRILLTYGSADEEVKAELERLTDDACIYSKRCPWRGEAPKENCVSDPSIPCTE